MRFSCTFCLAVAILFLMNKTSVAICYPSCPCGNITNVSAICNITYNGTNSRLDWQDFFEFEVNTIQRLDLTISNDLQSQLFPFQEFLLFNFRFLRELYIQILRADYRENEKFEMSFLENLPNLTKLVLRLRPIRLIVGNVRSPLHLRYLDVSNNGLLSFDNLAEIIKYSGTALEELYANRINNFIGASLDDNFFSSFEKSNLRIVHIVDSNIKIINTPNLSNFLPFLEYIDISQNSVDIYMSTFYGSRNLKQLKKLYASDTIVEDLREEKCEDSNQQERREAIFCALINFTGSYPLFRTLEVISIGGSKDCHNNALVLCGYKSKCTLPETIPIRELHLSSVCYKRFDVEIKGLHRLEIFDFSNNSCEYISSLVFSQMISLKTLLLNGNELSKMENRNPDEFTNLIQQNANLTYVDFSTNEFVKLPSNIFLYNIELKIINLSSNRFSRLPKGIFNNSLKLEILDLSNNLLIVTDWLSSTLINLRTLNLRNNRITTLDSETRNLIGSTSFNMLLANNPIDCSCKNEDLLIWLSSQKAHNLDITEVFCTDTGNSLSRHINDIESYSHDCELKKYIGLFGLFCIPVIVAICFVFYYRHYQNVRRIRIIRKQLTEFAKDNVGPQQHFLLYLAYCFADSETILKQIFPELETRLQRELKVDDKLVCISDRDFELGTYISDEIIRAISSCTVVLFVISKKFSSSRWCEFESEIAIYQQKPIIIVALEQVKIKSLPSSLRKVCYKWTRMEWPGKEDINKLENFWKKLTKSIIKYTDVKD